MPKLSSTRVSLVVVCLFVFASTVWLQTPTASPSQKNDPLKALQYRLIGPFRGGRVGAVTGVPVGVPESVGRW